MSLSHNTDKVKIFLYRQNTVCRWGIYWKEHEGQIWDQKVKTVFNEPPAHITSQNLLIFPGLAHRNLHINYRCSVCFRLILLYTWQLSAHMYDNWSQIETKECGGTHTSNMMTWIGSTITDVISWFWTWILENLGYRHNTYATDSQIVNPWRFEPVA